jgi:CrcB protein
MVQKWIYLSLAGTLGTLCRYCLTSIVQKLTTFTYPWGTLFVNVSGCFIAGGLFTFLDEFIHVSGEFRTVMFIGFLGSYTTFSTFILETSQLIKSSEYLLAIFNLLLHNMLGLIFYFAGVALIKILF